MLDAIRSERLREPLKSSIRQDCVDVARGLCQQSLEGAVDKDDEIIAFKISAVITTSTMR